MIEQDPAAAMKPDPKPIPENKTQEKILSESRRLHAYITAFRLRAQAFEALDTLARQLIAEPPLGMVGVDAYERRLANWKERLIQAVVEVNFRQRQLKEKAQ